MTYTNKYIIFPTQKFKDELGKIVDYIKYELKEPNVARIFYKRVIEKIYSLKFMPERYSKINLLYNKNIKLHKMIINRYVIIYKVNNRTRTSIYFTYISY